MKEFKDHFGLIVNVISAVLMGLFMGIATMMLSHATFNWVTVMTSWAKITFVVLAVQTFVPIVKWGNGFAAKVGCKPGTAAFTIVANIIPTLIINTILTAVLTAMDIFYNDALPKDGRVAVWLGAFCKGWTPAFFIAFVMSLIAAKIGITIAERTMKLPQ